MARLKAAVIGLGNIGFQFGLDPARKGTWSHVAAYERCERTELVGAVEVDANKTALFKRYHKDVPVFGSVRELMNMIKVDIASICTPTQTHYGIMKELLRYPIKGVFCEKPIAETVEQAKALLMLCRKRHVVLAVNHIRRWDPRYISARDAIRAGRIGNVKAVNALYSSQVFNIGTHMFDTVRMLTGKDGYLVSGYSSDLTDRDPDVSGWILLNGDIPCTITATGRRKDLIFEIDIIGDEGRVRIFDNGKKMALYTFAPSGHYAGYREPKAERTCPVPKKDRFVEAVNNIARAVERRQSRVGCSGEDGLASLKISVSLLESAKRGRPVQIRR